MSDCTNIEMRELLPDLLHGQLAEPVRARVQAHLESCTDCRAEFELLQAARGSLRGAPRAQLDTRAIVAALPRPRNRQAAPAMRRNNTWRIAAAITAIALGGVSLNAVREYAGMPSAVTSDSARDGVTPATVLPGDLVASADTPVAGTGRTGVTGGVGVTDLADEDLEALIGALDQLEAAPHVDPEANRFSRMIGGTTGGD